MLRVPLGQVARLLGQISPPPALGATLASRLHGVPALHSTLDRYRATLLRPLLEPAWPLPDKMDPDPVPAARHASGVTNCAISPDSSTLPTTTNDEAAVADQ
jgi:hypothetical protein